MDPPTEEAAWAAWGAAITAAVVPLRNPITVARNSPTAMLMTRRKILACMMFPSRGPRVAEEASGRFGPHAARSWVSPLDTLYSGPKWAAGAPVRKAQYLSP